MEKDKKNLSYEDMTKGGVYEESEVPYHDEPFENAFEKNIPGSDGLDHSGFGKK